ncbi:hypothetical protein DEI81_14255 [Curtobacterium sp. MCBD17_013]|nr:hypothetical protein DEI81_14255 [Curtobacterium sp. MCBD17_013]
MPRGPEPRPRPRSHPRCRPGPRAGPRRRPRSAQPGLRRGEPLPGPLPGLPVERRVVQDGGAFVEDPRCGGRHGDACETACAAIRAGGAPVDEPEPDAVGGSFDRVDGRDGHGRVHGHSLGTSRTGNRL